MSKKRTFHLIVLVFVVASVPADALTRYRRADNAFLNRTAISGYAGIGIPVGEFSSDRDGDGNHDSGALDWNFSVEHFFARSLSLGALLSGSTWQDKTDADLETELSSFGGFLRFVVPGQGPVYPFFLIGVTSTRLQFVDSFDRFRAERSGGFRLGGGFVGMLSENFAVTGSATYNQSSTYDAWIREVEDTIVGFDTKYWSFGAGLSVFLP